MGRSVTRFKLGDRVVFTDTMKKIRKESFTTWGRNGLPRDFSSVTGGVPINEGTIVGQRFLSDYELVQDSDYDEWRDKWYTWTEARTVKGSTRRAWLISYNLHRKPVLVLDEHVERKAE